MEEARQYPAVTPKLASLLFIAVWTAIMAGAGAWSWRLWRRSRQQRVVRTLFGDIEESYFPILFTILSGGALVSVAIAAPLVLFGLYEFLYLLGS